MDIKTEKRKKLSVQPVKVMDFIESITHLLEKRHMLNVRIVIEQVSIWVKIN